MPIQRKGLAIEKIGLKRVRERNRSLELEGGKGLKARQKGKCLLCIHKKNVGDYGRLQCCHPVVMEIGEKYPERKPGVIAATALNKMGKALKLNVHPDAYTSDRWFNWPWCYNPRKPSIVACSGFEKKH